MKVAYFLSALSLFIGVSLARPSFATELDLVHENFPRDVTAALDELFAQRLMRRGRSRSGSAGAADAPAAPSPGSPATSPFTGQRSSLPPEAERAEAMGAASTGRKATGTDTKIMNVPAGTETGQHAMDYSSNQGGHLGEPRAKSEGGNRGNAFGTDAGKAAEKNKKAEEANRGTKLTKDEKGYNTDKPLPGQPDPSVKNLSTKEQNKEGGKKSAVNTKAKPEHGGDGTTAVRTTGMTDAEKANAKKKGDSSIIPTPERGNSPASPTGSLGSGAGSKRGRSDSVSSQGSQGSQPPAKKKKSAKRSLAAVLQRRALEELVVREVNNALLQARYVEAMA